MGPVFLFIGLRLVLGGPARGQLLFWEARLQKLYFEQVNSYLSPPSLGPARSYLTIFQTPHLLPERSRDNLLSFLETRGVPGSCSHQPLDNFSRCPCGPEHLALESASLVLLSDCVLCVALLSQGQKSFLRTLFTSHLIPHP